MEYLFLAAVLAAVGVFAYQKFSVEIKAFFGKGE